MCDTHTFLVKEGIKQLLNNCFRLITSLQLMSLGEKVSYIPQISFKKAAARKKASKCMQLNEMVQVSSYRYPVLV